MMHPSKFISGIILCCFGSIIFFSCEKNETPYITERGTVTDIDGNIYSTVKIGERWWMAENLRTTKYNDGTPVQFIPVVDGADTTWASTDSAAYCAINEDIFGFLYNARVLESAKNIAPEGWHVPSDEEWKELERIAGMTVSETNQTGWRGTIEANTIASRYNLGWPANDRETGLFGSDFFGFNAKPSGIRSHDGRTNIQSNSAWWWCSTSESGKYYYRNIDIYHREIFRQVLLPRNGLSIRCVKD